MLFWVAVWEQVDHLCHPVPRDWNARFVHPLHDALCSENAQDHHVQKGVPHTPAASASNHVRARIAARFEASLRPSERMEAEQSDTGAPCAFNPWAYNASTRPFLLFPLAMHGTAFQYKRLAPVIIARDLRPLTLAFEMVNWRHGTQLLFWSTASQWLENRACSTGSEDQAHTAKSGFHS